MKIRRGVKADWAGLSALIHRAYADIKARVEAEQQDTAASTRRGSGRAAPPDEAGRRAKSVTAAASVPTTIDEYIAAAAPGARPLLKEIRRVVRAAAPDAEELISYRMPAFSRQGVLIYFAAFKHHVGVFPPVSGDARLERALAPYAGPKGNLKFPMDRPLPSALIRRIVKLRLEQNLARASARSARRLASQRAQRDGAARRR